MDAGLRVHEIDTQFVRPEFTAVFLLERDGRLMFFDTGVGPSVPLLLDAVDRLNRTAEDVDAIVVSHVHLDHGGGAGLLAAECPNATVYAHPRAVRHLTDPTKLIESARHVYGDEEFERLFEPILPIDADRVQETPDGFVLDWLGRKLEFYDAPGHARHHLIIFDPEDRSVFAGDAFGLHYPGSRAAFPTTSPTQFDPVAMVETYRRILKLKPERVFLAHFGMLEGSKVHAAHLTELVHKFEAAAKVGQDLVKQMQEEIHPSDLELFAFDVQMNAKGLEYWASQLPAADRK